MTEKTVQLKSKTLEFTSQSGVKYIFQKVRPMVWLGIMDEVEASDNKANTIMYPKVLENIVVSPKMEVDDFEDFAELDEVVKAAIRFQRGK